MVQEIFSKEQFKLLFGNSSDFVFFTEQEQEDFRYIYLNEPAQRILTKDAYGKKLSEVMNKNECDIIFSNYNKAIERNGQVSYQDYRYTASEVKKFETSVIPIFKNNRTFILAITKEISFDRNLQDKYLFMRSVFFNTSISTVLVSDDGKLLEANPQFLEDFNISIEEVRSRFFYDLPFVPKQLIKQLKQYLTDALEGKNLSSNLMAFIDKKGDLRSFTTTFSPIVQDNNEVVAVLVILQEITEFIQQQQELRMASNGLTNYRYAIDNAAEVTICDYDGVITYVNDRFVEQTGFSRQELIGSTHMLIDANYHSSEFYEHLWMTVRNGNVWRGEVCTRTKYGVTYWVDTTIIPLLDENGKIQQFLSVHYDITEKKRMLVELSNVEHMFKMITENTNDLIVITNQDGIISYASQAYTRKLGYKQEELIGQFYTKVLTHESKKVWNEELFNLEVNVTSKVELVHKFKNGESIWTECSYTVVNDYLRNHGIQIIMIAREITERKKIENQLLFLAYHDYLTQLPNRRFIQKEFPLLVEKAKQNNESFAILYVDGDNFKEVNDLYGHDVGDEFLVKFGKALSNSVRTNDLVVRLGGDEFAIILTGLVKNELKRNIQVEQIVKRIKETLEKGWVISEHLFTPTSSIGVSYYPDHGSKLQELLECSDRALYEAKSSSKGNFKIYQV